MKIIICCLNLYGGGAERVASLWAKGFHSDGHEVFLFLEENKVSYDIPNLPIVVIGNGQPTIKKYHDWYRLFKREFNRIKPDVFISVNHPWAIIAKLAAIGTGIRVVATEHNAYEKPDYIKMGWADKLHKFYLNRWVDVVTVLTEADRKYIGNRLHNVTVLPNPLSFEPRKNIPPKEKMILAVGRLDAWHVKGFDLLINAWKGLCSQYPDWKLRIVGYGADTTREYLRSLGSTINEHQFEILDFDENIIRQYQDAAVFVLSSRYDGFGMVLIEAMSQGCACIACDYKGRQREIITDGVDGIIVETNNVVAIRKALEKLLADNTKQKALQINAIIRSKDFALDKIMNKWYSVLDIQNDGKFYR